jgi:hypothetical protein
VSPGLVTSYLNMTGQFYVSVCRYEGLERKALMYAKAPTYEEAVYSIALRFLGGKEIMKLGARLRKDGVL